MVHRKLTLTEKEEERLWNGQEYSSLPDTSEPGNNHTRQQWHQQQVMAHPEPGLATLTQNLEGRVPDKVPHTPQGN